MANKKTNITVKDWKERMNKASLKECDEVLEKIAKAKSESKSDYLSVEANLKFTDLEGWVKDRITHIHFLSDLLGYEGGIK
tara:strand:+ start:1643 stop:1885 length:243 start_codon:yes stop_codon:yes gene_type:complete